MSDISNMIEALKQADFQDKIQFLNYLVNVAQKNRRALSDQDREALVNYLQELVDLLPREILDAPSYRRKDTFFTIGDCILFLIMELYPGPDQVPETLLQKTKALADMINQLRTIESTLDDLFTRDAITPTDLNRLLYWVRQTSDEFQRSKLYLGLVHYAGDLEKFTPEAKEQMGKFLQDELARLLSTGAPDEDRLIALELIVDVCRHFPREEMTDSLYRALELDSSDVRFYAAETLLCLNRTIPESVIRALAEDPVYANLTHNLLVNHGIAHLFPAELATEENLAKSDLVHWLTFPTELGKAPDAIEYVGKVKFLFRKYPYHVFKFRSDSNTLDEAGKNKWLVGWSSRDGKTFSDFVEYAQVEQETLEETLKYIKKHLIR